MTVVIDVDAARHLLGLRPLVVDAARRHRVLDRLGVRCGLDALDELERVLRAAEYGTSADLPLRPGDGWIGTTEAGRRLGITSRAVRLRIGSGRLRAARDRRGSWLIDPESIGDVR